MRSKTTQTHTVKHTMRRRRMACYKIEIFKSEFKAGLILYQGLASYTHTEF